MEKTINEQLGYICSGRSENSIEMAGLFDEWYHRTAQIGKEKRDGFGHYGLVCDGLMSKPNMDDVSLENKWWKEPKRIAFLMKDQNQDGYVYNTDARKWLCQKEDAWELRDKTFHHIANILWGIVNAAPNSSDMSNEFDKIKECFQQIPFAYVECKKQGGGSELDGKDLKPYLIDYKDLLYKEFDILMPNIFVCTNDKIYEFIQEYIKYKYPNTELTRVHPEKHNSIRLHLPSKTIILLGYHPTAPMSYGKIYDSYMDHYRAFLQSSYHDDFLK